MRIEVKGGAQMFFKSEREIEVDLEKGMSISVGKGMINLACVSGILWVTWPGSGDVILRGGEEVSVETDGVLCISAFSESRVKVRRGIFAKHLPGVFFGKIISAVSPRVKGEPGGPIPGSPVQWITR